MKKTHRFIGPYPLATGTLRLDDDELAHQMRSVLKLEVGEHVVIGDGTGNEAECRILRYDRGAVTVEGLSIGRNASELPGHTTLYCAVLKADHFELVVQKVTEIGISEIVPIITEHTVKTGVRTERLQKIVREAAELAGRGLVPVVREAIPMERVMTDASQNDVNLFFDPSGASFSGVAKSVRRAGIWIGPEGGWHEREVELSQTVGMKPISLGNLVLRAETAAIVAAYLVAHSLKM